MTRPGRDTNHRASGSAANRPDEEAAAAIKPAVHEAVCAERWKQPNDRLGRIKLVLAAIVLLLLVGEGNVTAVLRRTLAG